MKRGNDDMGTRWAKDGERIPIFVSGRDPKKRGMEQKNSKTRNSSLVRTLHALHEAS